MTDIEQIKKRAEEIKKFNYVADSKDLANAVLELCQRVEDLSAENKRLNDKYDFQQLVKRDESQQATIDKLVKAIKNINFDDMYYNHPNVRQDAYNKAIRDCDNRVKKARQCLAEVRGEL